MSLITKIRAVEILDSRGNPTVQVCLETDTGRRFVSSVPSGASTGSKEAFELRDGEANRFWGKGVLLAIEHIRNRIAPALLGKSVLDQEEIDHILLGLDGSVNKSLLGANALLGVSIAVYKAFFEEHGWDNFCSKKFTLPCPMMNIINGGVHSDNILLFQEFMIRPVGAGCFSEAVRWCTEIYQALKVILKKRGLSTSVGDEGGFAPNISSDKEAIEIILEAIVKSGRTPDKEIQIAIDCAASEFFDPISGRYCIDKMGIEHGTRSADEQVDYLVELVEKFPALDSIEDGLADVDWKGWQKLTKKLGSRCQLVGDDLFVTQVKELEKGVVRNVANSILVKLNQVGTVTETLEVIRLAKAKGYGYIPSHRSGDTEDPFLAEFAVIVGAEQIKTGAPCRSERTSKYNRLLALEEEYHANAVFAGKKFFLRK